MFDSVLSIMCQAGTATPPPQQGIQSFIFPLLMVGLLFYFMILRPQRRQQQEVKDMRNALKKGDKVRSIGGIHGTVTAVDTTRNIVTVQVDKNVKLDFDRDAISTVVRAKDDPAPAAAEVEAPAKVDDKVTK